MTERTIHVFAKSGMTIMRDSGAPCNQSDIVGNALNGDAFSWENPTDLSLTFPSQKVAITFDDKDGYLTDDPFAGSTVHDQQLTEATTINGKTYQPSDEHVRWKENPPVNIENEYEVTLFDAAGNCYRMVGVSITQGYNTEVVGVMFEGPEPPPGTVLHYKQGISQYSSGQSMEITDAASTFQVVVCFLEGTLIDTPEGPRQIETLAVGDRVLTLDDGPQPLRWTGRFEAFGRGALAPIRIAKGTFGNRRDLLVSPNHRMLLRSPAAELHFGHSEVLVPAKALVDGERVRPVPMRRVVYHHLLLDHHAAVFAESIASETLFLGDITLSIVGTAAQADLRENFPHLMSMTLCRSGLTPAETQVIGTSGFSGISWQGSVSPSDAQAVPQRVA